MPIVRSLSFFFLALCLAGPLALSAQKISPQRQKLEEQKVRLMDEIQLANRILKETQRDRSHSLSTIETVQQKLRLRERLIRTLDREIELLGEEERALQDETDTLRVRIEKQRARYAEMIRQAYKSRSSHNRLLFILAAEDFNQALRRLEYLKQYADYRQQQLREIEAREAQLAVNMERLRLQKVRKTAVRSQLGAEKQQLSTEKISQEEAIASFQKMETELEQKLRQNQAEAKRVEKEIQRIIAEEIARAKALAERNRLEEEAQSLDLVRGRDFSSNTSNERLRGLIAAKRREKAAANETAVEAPPAYERTPEAAQLAANFAANQKRLPWPVERGLVVGKFGPQRHPVVKSVIIENRGIDIATEKGSAIRAVFDGEVSNTFRLPDGQLAMIINHGGYFSVYQNIVDLKVGRGDKVSKNQVLGNSYTNPISLETKLHFEIWKDNQPVNPALWLSAR